MVADVQIHSGVSLPTEILRCEAYLSAAPLLDRGIILETKIMWLVSGMSSGAYQFSSAINRNSTLSIYRGLIVGKSNSIFRECLDADKNELTAFVQEDFQANDYYYY